jgi:hypothetical protein
MVKGTTYQGGHVLGNNLTNLPWLWEILILILAELFPCINHFVVMIWYMHNDLWLLRDSPTAFGLSVFFQLVALYCKHFSLTTCNCVLSSELFLINLRNKTLSLYSVGVVSLKSHISQGTEEYLVEVWKFWSLFFKKSLKQHLFFFFSTGLCIGHIMSEN